MFDVTLICNGWLWAFSASKNDCGWFTGFVHKSRELCSLSGPRFPNHFRGNCYGFYDFCRFVFEKCDIQSQHFLTNILLILWWGVVRCTHRTIILYESGIDILHYVFVACLGLSLASFWNVWRCSTCSVVPCKDGMSEMYEFDGWSTNK